MTSFYTHTSTTVNGSVHVSSHVSSTSSSSYRATSSITISAVDCLVSAIGNKLTAVVLTASALGLLALSVDALMIGSALLRVAFAGAFVAAGLTGAAYVLGSIAIIFVAAKLLHTAVKVF